MMALKVRHKELNDVRNVMFEDASRLNEEVNNLLETIEELKVVWQGVDSDTFYNESYNYVSKIKNIVNCFNVMGNFIGNANNFYEEKDNKLKNKLEKEAHNYEQDSNK